MPATHQSSPYLKRYRLPILHFQNSQRQNNGNTSTNNSYYNDLLNSPDDFESKMLMIESVQSNRKLINNHKEDDESNNNRPCVKNCRYTDFVYPMQIVSDKKNDLIYASCKAKKELSKADKNIPNNNNESTNYDKSGALLKQDEDILEELRNFSKLIQKEVEKFDLRYEAMKMNDEK